MQVMITKEKMVEFLDSTISKYETRPSGKYIAREFSHPKFNIKIYTTGTMTIDGSKQYDIYQKLMNYTGEDNSVGSDEVGVGDFFGPTVYCTVYITGASISYIANNYLTIKDSKKLTDDEIIDLYEKHLRDNIDYKCLSVFDSQIPEHLNSIEQKSYYHYSLLQNYKNFKYAVVDLYTTENNFWKVSKKLKQNWPQNTILETKADGKYYTVALASIIARYYFIKEMDKLDEKYNYNFPYGANVAKEAQKVADLLGKDEMAKFVKTSFKTYKELI